MEALSRDLPCNDHPDRAGVPHSFGCESGFTESGALLVEITLEDTPLSGIYDVQIRGKATKALAAMCGGLTA